MILKNPIDIFIKKLFFTSDSLPSLLFCSAYSTEIPFVDIFNIPWSHLVTVSQSIVDNCRN